MQEQYDLFISYSHSDRPFVANWLLPRLEDEGLKVCVDYRDFEVGAPSLVNMEQAIERSNHTIVVLTSAWVQSEWANFESLLVGSSDPAGRRRKLLPLRLDNCSPPSRIKMFTYADFRETSNRENELNKLLNQLGANVLENKDNLTEITDEKVKLFWLAYFVCVALYVSYPITLFLSVDNSNAFRWLKHEPAYNLFALMVLPIAFALFVRTFEPRKILQGLGRNAKAVFSIGFVFLFAISVYLGITDGLRKTVVQPFYFEDVELYVTKEAKLRKTIEEQKEKNIKYDSAIIENAKFANWDYFIDNAGFIAYLSIFLDSFGYCFVFMYFWLIAFIMAKNREMARSEKKNLALIFVLLITWFPMRIYSDWYLNFFQLSTIHNYSSFWIFLILAVVVGFIIVFKFKISEKLLIAESVLVLVVVAAAIVLHSSIEFLWFTWSIVDNMDFVQYLGVNAILLFCIWGLTLSVVEIDIHEK